MNIDFEAALTILKTNPTDLVAWSIVLDAFSNKVSSTRPINGEDLTTDIILLLASNDFVNQGTTTTVLHGNAAGNPSWGAVVTADITDDNVTYPKIQNVTTTNRVLGRITAGAGNIEELTGTQATSLLDLFATGSTTKGLVPGSNSVGTTYFLNGNGAWSVPAGGTTVHSTLSNLSYATAGHTGFEPTITAGTAAQYWRGDKTWQSIPSGTWGAIIGTLTDQGDLTTALGLKAPLAGANLTGTTTAELLSVDNITINTNTISSTSGNINITPVTGSNITLDGTIAIDAGVITGITSLGVTGTRVTAGFFVDLTVTNDIAGDITGSAASATNATNAANAYITNDTTSATRYPVWVVDSGSNQPLYTSEAKIWFNSSTGVLSCSGDIIAYATP
jgi:hypothetical protein